MEWQRQTGLMCKILQVRPRSNLTSHRPQSCLFYDVRLYDVERGVFIIELVGVAPLQTSEDVN